MTNDELYKVIVQGTQKLITMPKDSTGYYLRKVCQDEAVTFLPVKMPVSCQSIEQRGDVPK